MRGIPSLCPPSGRWGAPSVSSPRSVDSERSIGDLGTKLPAAQPAAHGLESTRAEPFVYRMIGERIRGDVVVCPDDAA